MKGTATGGALSFPASGQTWPALTNLFLGASRTTTPKDVTGTVDSRRQGRPDAVLRHAHQGSAPTSAPTGTVALSSQGTEKPRRSGGREGLGSGDWPVRCGEHHHTAPAATGSCLLINAAYDLSKGMGWYLTGTMTLPTAPPVAQKQTATVNVPKKVKREGKTVLLKTAVVTNAGQTATAKVTWSTKKNARAPRPNASVKITRAGKVTLRTTGKAKKLHVKLSLKAPATTGYRGLLYASGRSSRPAVYRNRRFSPDLLREARLGAGYSQAQLAQLVAVSIGNGQGLGNRASAPKPATQRQVADASGSGSTTWRSRADGGGPCAVCGRPAGWTRRQPLNGWACSRSRCSELKKAWVPPDPRKMARV